SLFLVASVEYHFLCRASAYCFAGKYAQFLSDHCLVTPEFFQFGSQPWTDFIGPISAQLGFALGYYCQWRSKNRSQRKKWGEWVMCLSFVTLERKSTRLNS